ncbi:MAG: late competence development ComFB family protein [Oscillospiraceae bacterium]|nr:late competence development ComFB family protein [Oscillospiraceae bacterium]
MAIINVMEKFINERLDDMLSSEDCCKCERCVDDMKAIALNKLPAKYVSTHNGELFSKLEASIRQNAVDINIAVAAAIDAVSKRPSH